MIFHSFMHFLPKISYINTCAFLSNRLFQRINTESVRSLDIKIKGFKLWTLLCQIHLFLVKSRMNNYIKYGIHNLTKSVRRLIIFVDSINFLKKLIRYWWSILVMFTDSSYYFTIPNPILKHLWRHLNEISFNICSRHWRKVCFCAHTMHDMSEFMEKGLHLIVVQQWIFGCVSSIHIYNHGCCRKN